MSQHDSSNHLMDKHHIMDSHHDAANPIASSRSLDSTYLLHLGTFGKVLMPHVSSIG